MKKPALIIGKKQIIMACLTSVLAIAVYVNYVISDGAPDKGLSAENMSQSEDYGETKFVNAGQSDLANLENFENVSAKDYFAQARIDKAASRDEAVQTLQSIMGGGDITENEAVVNAMAAVELSQMTELENKMESLIKAQGYNDCLVYLDEDDVKVVVQSEGLDTAQAAAIKDILISESTVPAQNIRIFEVK
ncbi:MAG: SpoIIIAH-like family protein [Oscillospiraceae bacterium]|nr:SpoIIIAH-like family protein [Oscillospiraceae bacterium]MBQ9982634.1 SpoIIIAH-like family protein [Oscillospiraceae bacterium]